VIVRSPAKNELSIHYMLLRRIVGGIGTLLPIVLIVGNTISSTTPRPDSMSGYYYTDMRNIFVGSLCALGVFLVAYYGYDNVDLWVTNIAGFGAIGVAFCPTKPAVCAPGTTGCPASSVTRLSASQQAVGDIHLFFAAVTFLALGVMALRFAKGGETPTLNDTLTGLRRVLARLRYALGFGQPANAAPEKFRGEDLIYHVCGLTIMSCVILAVLSNLLPSSVNADWSLLFIFEALAVFAFGVSWFTKGQTMHAIRSGLHISAPAERPAVGVAELADQP
jgi:hypothetical protein